MQAVKSMNIQIIPKAKQAQKGDICLAYARNRSWRSYMTYRVIATSANETLTFFGTLNDFKELLQVAKEEITWYRTYIKVGLPEDRDYYNRALKENQTIKKTMLAVIDSIKE